MQTLCEVPEASRGLAYPSRFGRGLHWRCPGGSGEKNHSSTSASNDIRNRFASDRRRAACRLPQAAANVSWQDGERMGRQIPFVPWISELEQWRTRLGTQVSGCRRRPLLDTTCQYPRWLQV